MKRFPFEWRNPFGYLTTVLMELIVGICESRFLVCFMNLALVGFMCTFVFAEDSVNDVYTINECVRTEKPESDVFKQFLVFVDMHGAAKELSAFFSKIEVV